jgi:hypothetical protein
MHKVTVCSETITAGDWDEIPMKELQVMENGVIVMREDMS